MKRNYKIEFLRFMFCLYVFFYHLEKYVFQSSQIGTNKLCFFTHGAIGVEFFFVTSGYLMAKNVYKNKDNKTNLLLDTYQFMKRKVKGIFIPHALAFIPTLLVTVVFIYHYNLIESIKYTLGSIPNFFLLQYIYKFPWDSPNHVEWYLSAMLISMTILYPIFRSNYKRFIYILGPCLIGIILIYSILNGYVLTGVSIWTIFCYKGMLRAILDITLGCIVFEATRILNSLNLNKTMCTVLSVIEITSFILVSIFTVVSVRLAYEYIALFFICINIVLAFSNKTWKMKFLNNKLTYFLGKISLPIYLCQLSGIYTTTYFLGLTYRRLGYMVAILLTVILALVVDYLTTYINKKKAAVVH